MQLCVYRKSIAGILLTHVNIRDSISDGLSVVAPGSSKGGATLSDVRLEQVHISNWGIGTSNCHALWIREDAVGSLTLVDSNILLSRTIPSTSASAASKANIRPSA